MFIYGFLNQYLATSILMYSLVALLLFVFDTTRLDEL